jgi:O-antigen/teichoic acid export membrane protein
MPFSSTISACYDVRWPSTRCALQPNRGFIAAAASIGLAASCWSFLCLFIGSVVGNAATVVLLIACRRDLGIFRPSLKGCRDVIGFGAYSSAVAVINVTYQSFPQLVLGRILDFTAVGL